MTTPTCATHDFVISNEYPLMIDDSDFTRIADDGTTMTFRADNFAVIAMAIGMTTKRRFVTRPLAAGAILTIERLPNTFAGYPSACRVSIPTTLTASTEESPNGPTA
jgi:hypothetical protein